jgi:hypothetical protein
MSLDPKAIYFTQRNAAGSDFEEVYVSGSNLILQTAPTVQLRGLLSCHPVFRL